MIADVIGLISVAKAKDEYGVIRETETEKEVYCDVQSVTRQEFFDGGRNGLNPAYVFIVFAADYSGEETVSFRGNRYGVYRTYENGDYMELYVERKGGTNG